MALNISVVAEPIIHIGIGKLVITNSLFTSWLVTGLLAGFALSFSRQPLRNKPKGASVQNFVELVIGGLLGLFTQIVGQKRVRQFFPLAATFFIFILFNNWVELLPGVGSIGFWQHHEGKKVLVPLFRAPTSDINTTLALAVTSVVSIQYYGLKTLGTTYLAKFLDFSGPIAFAVGILELISEFTKIISFAFRLFGNIFAGEVLLTVMAFIMPFLAPLPFLGLEIFVGLIQSLVFVMLTLAFLHIATNKYH